MTTRLDPYKNFKFRLEIDETVRAGFQEASGLDYENFEDNTARRLPGLMKYNSISLKMGKTDDRALFDWHKKAAVGKTERKSVSIVLMGEASQEQARWNFAFGCPTIWAGPTFHAEANDVAIELLVIEHEGIRQS